PDLPDAPALRHRQPGRRARRLPDEPELPDGDVPPRAGRGAGGELTVRSPARARLAEPGPPTGRRARDVRNGGSRDDVGRRSGLAELPRPRVRQRPPAAARGERLARG